MIIPGRIVPHTFLLNKLSRHCLNYLDMKKVIDRTNVSKYIKTLCVNCDQ